MTLRFRKKAVRWRGRTSHGHGAKKKARGGGSQGGRGYSGTHKHKYSLVTTGHVESYGYKGFHSMKKKVKTINIDDIEKKIGSEKEIDLTKLGYGKLLSRGVPAKSMSINVKSASKNAIKKIEKAGGKVTGLEKKKEKKAKLTAVAPAKK